MLTDVSVGVWSFRIDLMVFGRDCRAVCNLRMAVSIVSGFQNLQSIDYVRDRWIEQFFSVVGVSFAQAGQAVSGSQIMVQTVALPYRTSKNHLAIEWRY